MASTVITSLAFGGFSTVQVKTSIRGAAQSRSTSAGSSLSAGQSSLDAQKRRSPLTTPENSPLEHEFALPDYDYATPWAMEQVPQMCELEASQLQNELYALDSWLGDQVPSVPGYEMSPWATPFVPADTVAFPECDDTMPMEHAPLPDFEMSSLAGEFYPLDMAGEFYPSDMLAAAECDYSTTWSMEQSVQQPDFESLLLANLSYPSDMLGLPEYDYPTTFSTEQAAQLPNIDWPVPFDMKNTFEDTEISQPQSLEEFFEEQQTKSHPGSGISLPPGLEHLVDPEEAAARLIAAESALCVLAEDNEAPQDAASLPDGMLDAAVDCDTPQFWGEHAQARDVNIHPVLSYTPVQEAVLPLRLDSILASQLAASDTPLDIWSTEPVTAQQNHALGSLACPTAGSQAHFFGSCKPCAFLHTKGCSNGVLCPFCHVCDAGAKKRRSKENRSAVRSAKQTVMRWGC